MYCTTNCHQYEWSKYLLISWNCRSIFWYFVTTWINFFRTRVPFGFNFDIVLPFHLLTDWLQLLKFSCLIWWNVLSWGKSSCFLYLNCSLVPCNTFLVSLIFKTTFLSCLCMCVFVVDFRLDIFIPVCLDDWSSFRLFDSNLLSL